MLIISSLKRLARRMLKRPDWHNLRNLEPVSPQFGGERGTPVDRYYIEEFLATNSHLIRGNALEISESTYTKKFGGSKVSTFEVLHFTADNPNATIVGDLTKPADLPENLIDCFVCTQTFNFIYDFKKAIEGAHRMLKPGGVLLATLGGISQISRYDMDRWGDFWRFTDRSALQAFEDVFGQGNVGVETRGNVFAATCFLQGIALEEVTKGELDFRDENYQLLITVTATKQLQ